MMPRGHAIRGPSEPLSVFPRGARSGAMFVDRAVIYVKGGNGGRGCISFHREKFRPRGGPDGGDGGRGGNVVLIADEGMHSLLDFQYRRHFRAEDGGHGQGNNRHGKDGEDLVIRVPAGTIVRDQATGVVLADLTVHGQKAVVARGGRGGRGNARFATSTRQAPMFAEPGEKGEERWIELELRLLADVGLIGMPNAGKSTLLSKVSSARPKIADYPFTTIHPNLGVVTREDGRRLVMADIPGLIEGAHRGAGMGHDFLRHIQRTRILVHILDLSAPRDPLGDFSAINRELELYDPSLTSRPMVVALNKIDLPEARARVEEVASVLHAQGFRCFPISALTGEGVSSLLDALFALLAPPAQAS